MRLPEWSTLRIRRLKLRLKQCEAAKKLGVHVSILNLLENERPITISKRRDADLRTAYARLLDELEAKSGSGRKRYQREEHQ